MGKLADTLGELACYGSERYDDEKQRDVPEIRFLTLAIEEGAKEQGLTINN